MDVSEIVDSVDILAYIQQYCDLEERPGGEYWGLSPLKEENTPSFSVSPEMNRYYDFSTGCGGDVLDFICQYHQCSFNRGLKLLKQYANITDDGEEKTSSRLLATSIAKKFRKKETKTKPSKGVVLADDYMDRYDLNWDKLSVWEDEGITRQAMTEFQVRYDPFSDRIVYPIRSMTGKIINVCGRTLDPEFKEKRQRKYTYFHPLGTLDTIYGLWENREAIREKGEVILFEGAKSVMIASGWGIHNTGAILTSHLNPNQFQILIKLGVRIVFALDAEMDIRKDENIRRLIPYARVDWVRNKDGLLEEKDAPVDKGKEVFDRLYSERRRLK